MPAQRLRLSLLLPLAFGALAACSSAEPNQDAPVGPEFALPPPSPTSITPLDEPAIADRAKVELGKVLFNDARLSADGSLACASCHDVRHGGDDGRRVSIGIDGQPGAVNAPTVLNSALNFAQFWDGRALTLEAQIAATVTSSTEMSGNWRAIERKLAADRDFADRFERIYGAGPNEHDTIDAIAAYLRALITTDAPFDRFLAGDEDAITKEAAAGYDLFRRFGCISCHQGRNVGGNLFQQFGVMGDYFADRGNIRVEDYGRYNVTGREADRFRFKVPSLRNVAQTAPYFHDGSAATLHAAVRTMVRYQLGRPATEEQIEQLVAFLRSLSANVDEWLL